MIDLLTDEKTHSLGCAESSDPSSMIVFLHTPQSMNLGLSTGSQFHAETTIPVAVRLYPGPVVEREALWRNGLAYIIDQQLVRSLLLQIVNSEKFVIRVGTESAAIPLAGVALAVQDFRQRAGLQPQQSLDIPAQ